MKSGAVKITGVKAIDQVFRQLPPYIQTSVLSSAFVVTVCATRSPPDKNKTNKNHIVKYNQLT